MTLPLIPLGIGLTSAGAGAALNYWLTDGKADPWADKSVFNARMRDMQALALALNTGFAKCKAFLSDAAQLAAWRGVRDNYSKFYNETGKLVYLSPSEAQIEQAKAYASRLYFWTGEYARLKCGGPVTQGKDSVDPYAPPAPPVPQTDWASIVKWGAIGLGGAWALKTVSDLFRTYAPR